MSLTKNISDAHISEAASRAGMSEDSLRKHLDSINPQNLHNQIANLSISDAGEKCKSIDFDIKIFSVKGKVCFTPGDDWRLTIDLTLSLAGIELSNAKYEFSSKNTEVCYSYDVLIGSLSVCFGVKTTSGFCLYTRGTACAFGSCTDWNETLICF